MLLASRTVQRMECFQTKSLQSCAKQGLLITFSGSQPHARLATSQAAHRTVSAEGYRGRTQNRRPANLNRFSHAKLVAVGSQKGEICGVHLVSGSKIVGLQRGRSAVPAFSATARPIDFDDDASVEAVPAQAKNLVEDGVDWLDAFHRFSRPHTVIGSAMGVISVSLLTIQNPAELSSAFFRGLFQAVVPALFMNIYIVGLNQLYDVDIDKVNKPYLPLASGEFSMTTGVTIVAISGALSLAIGVMVGSRPLLWTLLVSLFLGTAYSVDIPFLRWKRSAIAAATCILAVRAVAVQIGFYYHMQCFVFGRVPAMTRQLLFATVFMSFFSVVIALAKDLPDVEGDKVYGIRSFSVRLGQEKVFWSCVWFIQAAYAVAMSVGLTSPVLLGKFAMIVGHAGLSTVLWLKAKATNLKSKADIVSFYMFVWQLFYAEYLIIPFVR